MDEEQCDAPSYTTHIDLPVEPAEAWGFIGEPDSLAAWLIGDAQVVDLVIEPGAEGSIRLPTAGDDDDDVTFIIVEEVTPGERLVLRWASASKPPTSVAFDIVPLVHATRIVITEQPVPHGLAALTGRLCAVR